MARLFPLGVGQNGRRNRTMMAAALMVLFLEVASMEAVPLTNVPPSSPTPPMAPMDATAAQAVKPAIPPVPQDYFQQYGKILAPGTEPSHPLKLAMPMPEVGQIKIPSQAEIDMRVKLEQLATLSDEEIRVDLYHWPAFAKMNLADEGAMLVRIQQFRDRRSHIAQEKAHALGLVTLKAEQMAQFEKEYWAKRLQLDRDLAKQFEPILKAREAKISEELFREFSVPSKPGQSLAENNKPAAPAPSSPPLSQDPKPPATAPAAMAPGH